MVQSRRILKTVMDSRSQAYSIRLLLSGGNDSVGEFQKIFQTLLILLFLDKLL